MKAVLIILSIIVSVQAHAQEATELMRQVHLQYTQRFDVNGKFINDAGLTARFSASQKNIIQKLKDAGNVKRSFKIYNNVMANIVITASVVEEKSGNFAGLLIERSQYEGPNTEALLRLYNIPILLGGMDMFTLDGGTVINLKSVHLTAELAGALTIKYPTNYNNKTFGSVEVNIAKATDGYFGFYNTSGAGFTQVSLDIWYTLFPQNFGIKSVQLK